MPSRAGRHKPLLPPGCGCGHRHRVNREGWREALRVDAGASEDGAFWLAFLRGLAARSLRGAQPSCSWVKACSSIGLWLPVLYKYMSPNSPSWAQTS
jgi:hypothetical protein